MIESVLLVFWVVLVVSPLVTLAHELAHALVAATVSARPVLVRVGAEPALVRFTLGRLRFRLNPWRGWVGLASWEEQGVSVWRAIGVSAAGPLASLLLAVALALAAMALSGFAAEMAGTAGLYAYRVRAYGFSVALPELVERLRRPGKRRLTRLASAARRLTSRPAGNVSPRRSSASTT
jgi:hypothetical protein